MIELIPQLIPILKMQIVKVLVIALSSISWTAARPVGQPGQTDVSIQAAGPALDTRDQQFQPVYSPPKTVSARSDENGDPSNNLRKRTFDPVSPPPKVLPPPGPQVKERGFDPVSPPPKILPPHGPVIEERNFQPLSPPPKALPPPSDGARKRSFNLISPPPKVAHPQYDGASKLRDRRDGFVKMVRPQA